MRVRSRERWIAAALGVVLLLAAGRILPLREWLRAFGNWLSDLGPEAYVLYAAAYVIVTLLLLPAVLMSIGAGLLFGLLPGVAVVSVGSTAGAAAAFLIARHLARERVARYAARSERFAAIDRAIGEKGWKIVFLLRLSPLMPFVLSNYLYGLTAIRFWPYIAASWAGMIPLTVLYVSFGAAGREAAKADSVPGAPWHWVVLAVGILVTFAATAYAARVARRALQNERVVPRG